MVTHVGTRVRVNDLENAAMGLGLTSEAAKTTIIRGALALFHDLDPLQYTQPSRNHTEMIEISTPVPDELAVVPEGMTRATAIRIGLALARGMTREEAEEWATDPDNFKGLYRGYRRNT